MHGFAPFCLLGFSEAVFGVYEIAKYGEFAADITHRFNLLAQVG